jgi:hypothetical protein
MTLKREAGTEHGKWNQNVREKAEAGGSVDWSLRDYVAASSAKRELHANIRSSNRESTAASRVWQSLRHKIFTNMTSYIPSLTLPSFLFENPAAAILLPVACGTAIGFSISRQ